MLLAFAVLLVPAVAQGQVWRSSLYPENWQRRGDSVSFTSDKLIQDFSFAGYRRGEEAIPDAVGPVFNVTDYGAVPDTGADSTVAIQAAINAAIKGDSPSMSSLSQMLLYVINLVPT